MQARPLPLSTKIVLWFVALFVIAMFVLPGEVISYAKYNARFATCKADLKQVGLATLAYQKNHAGKMPPSLKALIPTLGGQNVFICPLSSTEATPAYHTVSYEYRFLSNPNGTDIICWDSHPHRRWQTYFVWLNHPNRNVLLADGQVENMREEEFQRLRLSGQSWFLPQQ